MVVDVVGVEVVVVVMLLVVVEVVVVVAATREGEEFSELFCVYTTHGHYE